MRRLLQRLWQAGIIGNFLTGLFFILPVALTVAIIGWLIGKLESLLGPDTWFGDLLSIGGSAIIGPHHSTIAFWLGLLLAFGGIWVIGFVVRSRLRVQLEGLLSGLLKKVPIVRTIYGPVSQVVDLLRNDKSDTVKRMTVVMCHFGREHGASVLGLLTSPTVYRLETGPSHLIYLPTSPLPMSGGLTFVPVDAVSPVPELDVDGLMRIYFSLGALSQQVLPERLQGGDAVPAA